MATRKLSKPMRRINLVYKIFMSLLAGLNVFLASFSKAPQIYFEIVSILSSACPVVWSQILDACKDYSGESTPNETSPALEPTDPNKKNVVEK